MIVLILVAKTWLVHQSFPSENCAVAIVKANDCMTIERSNSCSSEWLEFNRIAEADELEPVKQCIGSLKQ